MKLSKQMILSFVSLVIVSILIISSVSNIMINRSFKFYLTEEREDKFKRIYKEINTSYIDNDFKLDSMELKHLSLSNDIVITIKDLNGKTKYSSKRMGMGRMYGNMHNNSMQNNDNFIEKSYTLYNDNNPIAYLLIGYVDNAYLTDSANLFKNALFRSFIISGFITILIGLIISIILSKRLTKPLIMIKNTANEIKEGNLNASSNIDTDIKEIIELSNSINFLGKTLKNQEDIRKRYALDISHELRTPLTTLQTHLEAIIDGVWDPTKEHLEILMSETRRLKILIDNLKDSFTQEEYKVNLNKSTFNISTVVKDTIIAFLPIYNSKNYNIKYDIEDNIEVFMDKDKIKQIINNLLSNGVRYLGENGEVFIELKRSQTNLVLTIKDNGIGIKKENLPFIFDRFFRVDSSRNKETGGTGLGLSIVESIVKAHNGEINVESLENEFTKFTIVFPL
ncbi:sensor histidine kinase [Tissierella creatinophila]|uniref:histidine kinase n=1 Tax=Tissierella creatinophila DSM 6911 TaxID=1123403 RepID=A0A1U7M8P4_TISCR|nr:HAMP domain-containing sensor histidine kinase [Tissierella creatinophila]OLS03655.1 signal transduction histidine-protein kinase BaeS [Tissierella creatinophila DSM 6911]